MLNKSQSQLHRSIVAAFAYLFLCNGAAISQDPLWKQKVDAYQKQYNALNWPAQESAARSALNQALSGGVKGKALADAHQKLAEAIFNQYRFPDALGEYQAALQIREACLPPDSVDIGRSLYGVGFCLKQTNPAQAAQLLTRSLRIMEKHFGPESPEDGPPLAAMLVIEFSRGNAGAARQIQERLAVISAKRPGATIDEKYQENVQTSIFRNYDGDTVGSKQALLEAKKIRDCAPPGSFPPDNLTDHLDWADKRQYKPQDLRSELVTNYNQPLTGRRPISPGTPTQITPPPTVPRNDSAAEESPSKNRIANLPSRPKKHPGNYTYYIDGKSVSYDVYRSRELYNDAGDLVKSKQYDRARAKLEDALNLDPRFADGVCALGTVLAHLGLKEDAVQKLQQAVNIKPQLESAWIALAGIYEEVGKVNEALDAYRQFLRRFPNDPSNAMILSTTRLAELELRSREKKSLCPKIIGADGIHDYVVDAAREGLERWPKKDFPITIYIKPIAGRLGNVDAPKLFRQSLKEWTDRTNGLMSFREVASPGEAKIVVGWVTTSGQLNEDAEAGEALVERADGDIEDAKVSIDIRKPDADQFEGKLHTTILHEVGHCLGLIGHSPSATDVMYFTELMTGPIRGLSDRDIKTVELIYSYPATASR